MIPAKVVHTLVSPIIKIEDRIGNNFFLFKFLHISTKVTESLKKNVTPRTIVKSTARKSCFANNCNKAGLSFIKSIFK